MDASTLLPPSASLSAIGTSLVDINSDGLIDIYRNKKLYIQQVDGTFIDQFDALGIEDNSGTVFGSIGGDYDQDGFLDLFFMDLTEPSKLYKNRAGMRYTQSNTDTGILDQDLAQGSLWTDFNQDGLLDLFVGIDFGVSSLFINQQNNFFSNIADQTGLEFQAAYGLAAADFDRDGDIDIFLTQCLPPTGTGIAENVLLQHNGNSFINISQDVGIVDDLSSWGTVWLDYDNDGWLDIYTVNNDQRDQFGSGRPGNNTLYKNNEGINFTDVSLPTGVAGDSSSSNIGVAAADFDNDGWIDLFVSDRRSEQSNLFRNKGDGTFEDILPSLSITAAASQSVAVGDINNDGWIDLFIPALNDQLLINEGGTNHYLKVHTRGVASNLFGIGARIDVFANGIRQIREISAGDGMTSQNHNLTAHFGLGEASMIDSLTVRWPSGIVDRLYAIPGDQEITIVENSGINNAPAPFMLALPSGNTTPDFNQIAFSWNTSSDLEQDTLMYSLHVLGPDLDSTFTPVQSLSRDVDAALFSTGTSYRWSVSTTDGYSVRGTNYKEFSLSDITSNEPLIERAHTFDKIEVYPNPFSTSVTLSYNLHEASTVNIVVYNMLGKPVSRIANQFQAAGAHAFVWNGINQQGVSVPPGAYAIRLKASAQEVTSIITRQ